MEAILQFFTVLLTAALFENAVFARAFGSDRTVIAENDPRTLVAFSVMIGVMTSLSAVLSLFFVHLLDEYILVASSYQRTMPVLAAVFIIYLLYYAAAKRFAPKYFARYKGIIPLAAFSCVVYGSVLVIVGESYTLPQSLGYGLGAGLGVFLASALLFVGRRRMELCRIPKAFLGLPSVLLYIGLLSLAFYGLLGHGLPT
mgnify:CR=1 FL=1